MPGWVEHHAKSVQVAAFRLGGDAAVLLPAVGGAPTSDQERATTGGRDAEWAGP